MKTITLLLTLLPISAWCAGFVHPGLLHTQADFNRMAQMVQNKTAPWINSWNILINNWQANPSYNPGPVPIATRGSGCNPGDNSRNLMNDVAAAYQLALRWKITGNTSYADAAVKIMNAWSSTLTQISCGSGWDFVLMAGIQGYQFANAGEIMRNYSGLSAANFTAFQKMMSTVFYPWPSQGWLPNTALTTYSSWDLLGIAAGMAIGVLCDNQTIFNQAISNFYFAYGNGGIHNMVYYVHPGYLGQTQESGRDQGHNTLSIALLGVIAEQAWNQGIDLYGYSNNRVLAAAEYVARGNLIQNGSTYYPVPFRNYMVNVWPNGLYDGGFSTGAIGNLRPSWAKIYHHYVNRIGLSAPYTGKMMNLVAPDGGGGNYGGNSGGYDQLGFETLTFTRSNISAGRPPSGLTSVLQNGSVVLSWWGSAYATSYNVYCGTSPTVFSQIASVVDPRTYTDNVAAGTYYYLVTAVTAQGESSFSNFVQIVANPQALNTYYKFDETSGTSAADSSGNGHTATLVGNVSRVPGIIGNAIQFDGSTGYVNISSNVVANLSDFTIATWVKVNSLASFARIFDFGFGTYRYLFFAPLGGNGKSTFAITANEGVGEWQIQNASLPTGKWCHVAITLLGTTGSYYLNGTLIQSNPVYQQPYQLAMGADAMTPQVYIGRSQYPSDPKLNGIIDDFRIYQGALTAAQVSALYSSGASG